MSRRTLAALVALHALVLPAAAQAYEPQLTRYPYLTDVVGTSATVNWGTDRSSTTGRVRYGRVGSGSCTGWSRSATRTSITVGDTPQYGWKATLTGLAPGVRYCYRVELGARDLLGADASPRFYAQLPAGWSRPYTFAVLGDWGATGINSAGPDNRQADVLGRIAASGARFAIGTGDTAYPGGTQTNYGDLVQTGPSVSTVFAPQFWKRAGSSIALFNAVGNHGFNSTFLRIWPQAAAASSSGGRYVAETYCCVNGTNSATYPSAWYAFDAGNARFYVLEAAWSEGNNGTADPYKNDYDAHWRPDGEQYRWLEADLASHRSQLKFAVFHYPLYSSNATEESDPWLRGPDSLEGLLARYGVDIGFSGHAHNYTRNAKPHSGSLITYVTGGGGARLQPATRCAAPVAYAIGWSYSSGGSSCGPAPRPTSTAQVFHFLKVSVDGARVTVTPTDSQGRTFDVRTYDFSPPGSPTPPTGLTARATGPDRVELSWSASTDNKGVTGYEIHRDDAPLARTSGPATAYADATAEPGTTYTYRVRALDGDGQVSNWSNRATATTPAAPSPKISLVRQATGGTPLAASSFAVPISSTLGNALVASIAVQAGSTTSVSRVTDSAGNTWTRGPVGFLPGSNTRVEIWFTTAAAPVSSVRVDLSAPDLAGANVSEWRGVAPAGALDFFGARGNAFSTTAATPAITTTRAGDLIVGAINYPRAANSSLATAGFAELHDFDASPVNGRASYRVASPIGSYSVAWMLSAASTSGGAILALRAAP